MLTHIKPTIAKLFIVPLLTLLTFSLTSNQVLAYDHHTQTLDELKIAIEKIRVETNTPALGIALVNKDGPYWVTGLGEADREKHIKADENTMFRIGSVSKMFVALSIQKLVEEKKLRLTDAVHDLVPEIQFENKWEKSNPILLVHLLEHTTGWDEWSLAEFAYEAPDSLSIKEALNYRPNSRKSRWVPGTRYAYSNLGPAVAAYIVEKITGKKFEDYVRENFLSPLNMSDATYYESENYKKLGAVLYTNNQPEHYFHCIYRPVGSLNASAKEMANLLQLFIQRGNVNGTQLISNESILRMETPKTTLGAEQGILAGYGLHDEASGFEDYGIAFYGHEGYVPGARAELRYSKELQAGYVIMASSANQSIDQISEVLKRYLLKDTKKKDIKTIPLSEKFNNASGFYVLINPRGEIQRHETDISNAIKVTVHDNKIHRSPFFGGWESNDYAIAKNLVVNPWSGLPSIAFVNDPLAGETLQVEGNLYKKTSGVVLYGKIVFLVTLITAIILNFMYGLVSIPRSLYKCELGAKFTIKIWPFLTSLTIIIAFFAPKILGVTWRGLGTANTATVTVFICSILYPLLAAYSLLNLYRYRTEPIGKVFFWNAVMISILHALFALYLANYGMISFRSWDY